MEMVEIARKIALKAHAGQLRRDGLTPYTSHVEAVANRCSGQCGDVVATAWLHDVLEDTTETQDSLLAAGIPQRVVDAVIVLTKSGAASYEDYIAGIKGDEIARRVKIQDMLHNLSDSPSRTQVIKYCKGLLSILDAQS